MIQGQRRNYAFITDYRPYIAGFMAGFMAAGFPGYPRFGLAVPYITYSRRYSADYLAAAKGI